MSDFVFIKAGKTTIKLFYDDIILFKGLGNYTQIFAKDARKLIYYKTLKELIEVLPNDFMRVHNSYIVNIKHIDKIEDNHIFLGDHNVPVSSNQRSCLFERIDQYKL